MVKKKHREYTLDDLREGNTRMVDPNVNPDKDAYDDDFEMGIDSKLQSGTRRWTLDTYKEREGSHKTPKMTEQQLKNIIKECIREILNQR